MEQGRRATYVSDRPGDVPDIWAAVPVKGGHVLSLHTGFTDRSTDILKDLDQALVIGSIAVVFGGSALGVLIGGQLSRRLRKAAAAANRVANGRRRARPGPISGVVRDETDDLARAVDAMADALQQRLDAEAPGHRQLRTPVTGLLTAANCCPGPPDGLVRPGEGQRTLAERPGSAHLEALRTATAEHPSWPGHPPGRRTPRSRCGWCARPLIMANSWTAVVGRVRHRRQRRPQSASSELRLCAARSGSGSLRPRAWRSSRV
ncbi:hypothetical protein SALBM311S_07076 [Streptomyces alboniger]